MALRETTKLASLLRMDLSLGPELPLLRPAICFELTFLRLFYWCFWYTFFSDSMSNEILLSFWRGFDQWSPRVVSMVV